MDFASEQSSGRASNPHTVDFKDGQQSAPAHSLQPELDAGRFRTCALRLDGTVLCWGDDLSYWGGESGTAWSARAIALPDRATEIGVGDTHACALLGDGTVACWGSADDGRLGTGDAGSQPEPRRVLGSEGQVLAAVDRIAVGARHACAASGSRVWCWGQNLSWQVTGSVLGTSPTEPVSVAVEIPWSVADKKAEGLAHLSAGETSTCVIRSGAAPDLICWGRPALATGGLVSGGSGDSGRFLRISTGLGETASLRMIDGASCAAGMRTAGGPAVRCWGSNRLQDFGLGLDWIGSEGVDIGPRSACAVVEARVACRSGLGEPALVEGISGALEVRVYPESWPGWFKVLFSELKFAKALRQASNRPASSGEPFSDASVR